MVEIWSWGRLHVSAFKDTHTHTYHFGIGRPKPEIEAFIPFHAVDGIDATDADHFYIQKYQVKKKKQQERKK